MPGVFKAVIEPAVIAGIFTASCLINRRRSSFAAQPEDLERRPLTLQVEDNSQGSYHGGTSSSSPGSFLTSKSPSLKAVADATPEETEDAQPRELPLFWDLMSRFWNKYPFLPEIWYWNLTYWVYQLLRAFSARMIAGNKPIFDLALTHALQILSLEHTLHMDIELGVQKYFLTNHADWMPLLAHIYHSHICIGVAFIVYTYTYIPRSIFYRIRRTVAIDNVLAFVIVTTWRCSPPRLLPPSYGFVDVLHGKHPQLGGGHDTPWTNNRFQLTIAAMPSLHFGTALFFAVCLWRFAPHRVVRWAAVVWPVAMLVTIVATANHFLMDALVGALVPALGWRVAHWMAVLHRVELKVFEPVWKRMDIEGYEEREVDCQ